MLLNGSHGGSFDNHHRQLVKGCKPQVVMGVYIWYFWRSAKDLLLTIESFVFVHVLIKLGQSLPIKLGFRVELSQVQILRWYQMLINGGHGGFFDNRHRQFVKGCQPQATMACLHVVLLAFRKRSAIDYWVICFCPRTICLVLDMVSLDPTVTLNRGMAKFNPCKIQPILIPLTSFQG